MISIYMIYKAIKLDEIFKGVSVEREKRNGLRTQPQSILIIMVWGEEEEPAMETKKEAKQVSMGCQTFNE